MLCLRRETPAISRPVDSCSLFVLNDDMSVILEINRDYPYQVALSFDDAAMDILDWFEECDFECPGEYRQVLLPHIGGCLGIQAAVWKCVGRASCRQRQLIEAGRTK